MRFILSLAFLLATSFAFGQKLHELKTDIITPFVNIAHLAYEFNPGGRWGIEAGTWYRWSEEGTYYIPTTSTEPEAMGTYIYVNQQVLIATVAAKYYFFKKRNGTGLYLGGYMREDVLISRRDHDYLFISNYSIGNNYQRNRQLRLAAGLQAGYKYLIGKHILLEASIGFDHGFFENERLEDYAGILGVRLGYRL